jgi:hypothetical protein
VPLQDYVPVASLGGVVAVGTLILKAVQWRSEDSEINAERSRMRAADAESRADRAEERADREAGGRDKAEHEADQLRTQVRELGQEPVV